MDNTNFIWGGPVHKLQLKLKLDKEPASIVKRKIIFFSLFAWLPLLLICIIQSTAWNPSLKVSLLTDYVVWARFFVALPILFLSESIIKLHVGDSLVHFLKSGIIAENNINEYESLLNKLNKIKDSKITEIIILISAYAIVLLFWKDADQKKFLSTWLFDGKGDMYISGYWYYFVSAPLFSFFLNRMLFKFFLWAWFLFKISRMELNLYPTDPDLCAGLRFLGVAQVFFGIIGLAQSCVASAEIAKWISMNNYPLSDYYVTIASNIFISVLLFFSPILLFMGKISMTKLKGMMDYGVVAHKYIRSFDDKWVKGKNPEKEQLLGTADIQSLADLFNSYQVVEKMRMIPMDMHQILYLILIVGVPFLPLITFVIPLKDILGMIINHFI
jgi:hypothetical protein